VLPTRGPASGSLVTVSGFGFSTTPGAYACRFYRANPTGHEWIPDQAAMVVAEPRSTRELVCNTSGAWSAQGFSSGRVKVAVEHRQQVMENAELLGGVDAWAVQVNFCFFASFFLTSLSTSSSSLTSLLTSGGPQLFGR